VVRRICLLVLFTAMMSSGTLSAYAEDLTPAPASVDPGDRVSDTGISLEVPPPGDMVIAEEITLSGTQSFGVSVKEDGSVFYINLGLENSNDEIGVLPNTPGPDNGCTDFYVVSPSQSGIGPLDTLVGAYKWYVTMGLHVVTSSIPSNFTASAIMTDVDADADKWVNADNCGLADQVSATHGTVGTSTDSVDITSDSSNISCNGWHTRNDQNQIGFGTLPANVPATTCVWVTGDATKSPRAADEADTRLNKAFFDWYITEPSNCSQKLSFPGVMTHELGHWFGLGHAPESTHPWLTMSTDINGYCQQSESSLGKGDILGMRGIY
jgi:hypothetical protein